MRLFTIALLSLWFALYPPARAQTAAPATAAPPATTLTPAQAQAVLNVLQDDKARASFTAVLQDMVRAIPAAAPAKPAVVPLVADGVGAQLLVAGSSWAHELAGQFSATAQAIGDVPLLWRWLAATVTDPQARARLLDTGWKLVVILVAAGCIEWAARRLLGRPRRLLAARAPADEPVPSQSDSQDTPNPGRHSGISVAWRMLRRLPFVCIALMIDLIPVAVFAAVGHALLTTPLGNTTNTRLVVLAMVDAYVTCRVLMCVTRSFVSPREHRLRLIQCDDHAAEFIEDWVQRISAVAVFGFAVAEVGSLFGLYSEAHDVLLKLVGLVVHVMLVIVVVQSRHAVANRLRPRKHRTGVLATLQTHFAANWHVVAIFYIVALWLVAAAEIRNGYQRLLNFFLVTIAVLIVSRLVGIILLGGLDRAARLGPETSLRYPGLEQRLVYYYPALRMLMVVLVSAASFVALLAAWGFSPFTWFSTGQLGGRLLSALGTSAIAVLAAVAVWELTNAAVENKVASLTRGAQMARAARLRTLLPMLRTALFVTILIITGLVVLSEVGLNIAPLLAGAGVLGVAIGFGSQKLVQDLITGLFLLLENAMQVGDVVTLGGLSGTVEYLSIRTIRLRAVDGSLHIIPFSSVTTVTNQTRDFSYVLADLPIGLNEEPDRVADLLRDVAARMRAEPQWEEAISADLEVMGVYAFADNAWTMRVRLRTAPGQRWAVGREFNRRVKYCFDENAVQSPITAYKVQGWLPPGAERPIPTQEPPPPPPPPSQDMPTASTAPAAQEPR